MDALKLKETEDSPLVVLDAENNIFEISGRSLPEDAKVSFAPVIDWLDTYTLNPNPRTELIFKMNYFNSASAKEILKILKKLDDIQKNGYEVFVVWKYLEKDSGMKQAGEEYAELVKIPFEITSY